MDKENKTDLWRDFKVNVDELCLSITQECNLDCDYCCVTRKEGSISLIDGVKATDLLFKNGTNPKNLSFSGGEPLLYFDKLRKITNYACSKARKKGVKLNLSVATNGTICNEEILSFLRNNNFQVMVSLSGDKKNHDRFRHYSNKEGSYQIIKNNFKYIKRIDSNKLIATLLVHPLAVNSVFENFLHLVRNGFKIIYFCIVEGVKWDFKNYLVLKKEVMRVYRYVINQIKQNKHLYLYVPLKELVRKYLELEPYYYCDGSSNCPLEFKLRIFPNGMITLSNFILTEIVSDNYVLGDLSKGFKERFLNCQFQPGSKRCQECIDFLSLQDKRFYYDFSRMVKLEREQALIEKKAKMLLCEGGLLDKFVNYIYRKSRQDGRFSAYLEQAQAIQVTT